MFLWYLRKKLFSYWVCTSDKSLFIPPLWSGVLCVLSEDFFFLCGFLDPGKFHFYFLLPPMSSWLFPGSCLQPRLNHLQKLNSNFSGYLVLLNKPPQTATIICFSPASARWSKPSKDNWSLLHDIRGLSGVIQTTGPGMAEGWLDTSLFL